MTTNSLMGAEALAEVDRPRARVPETVLARNDILDGQMEESERLSQPVPD